MLVCWYVGSDGRLYDFFWMMFYDNFSTASQNIRVGNFFKRWVDKIFQIGRIHKYQIKFLAMFGKVFNCDIYGFWKYLCPFPKPAELDVFLDYAHCLARRVNKCRMPCAARERLKPNCAGAGEEIQYVEAFHIKKDIKYRPLHLVQCRANVVRSGGTKPSSPCRA